MKKAKFWAAVRVVLLSEKFKSILQDLILKFLKLQVSGGIRGWLIKTLVGNFADEVIEVVSDTVHYVEIKTVVNSTIDMEDRYEAADTLNDIMRG